MNNLNVAKEKIKSIILKSNKEVTNKTAYKTGGVYMLYIDCFDDENVLPIYIGETSDFQRRHKEHMTQIMSLNRLKYENYKYYLLNNFYNGNYKACKIFCFMVNHNCTLKDLHMIILDEFEDAYGMIIQRRQLEYNYINELNSQYYGFNQLPCISNSFIGEQDEELMKKEILGLLDNVDSGFGLFNVFVNYQYVVKFIDDILKSNKQINSVLKGVQRIKEIKEEFRELYRHIENIKQGFKSLCKNDIAIYFSENKLKSEEKMSMIYDILLLDKDDKEFKGYIKRFAKGNGEDILNQLRTKYSKEIIDVKSEQIIYNEKASILQNNLNVLLETLFSQLLPINIYTSHPLKDGYSDFIFKNIKYDVDNALYINIEYSCFKTDYRYDIYPEILKINYLFIKDGIKIINEHYIKTGLEKFWNNSDIYYYEKDFNNIYNFHPNPFNLGLCGDVNTILPVLMEYRNGINEYTLQDKPFVELYSVFDEIDKLINKKTKVFYTTNGNKGTIKNFKFQQNVENTLILKKLITACKKGA